MEARFPNRVHEHDHGSHDPRSSRPPRHGACGRVGDSPDRVPAGSHRARAPAAASREADPCRGLGVVVRMRLGTAEHSRIRDVLTGLVLRCFRPGGDRRDRGVLASVGAMDLVPPDSRAEKHPSVMAAADCSACCCLRRSLRGTYPRPGDPHGRNGLSPRAGAEILPGPWIRFAHDEPLRPHFPRGRDAFSVCVRDRQGISGQDRALLVPRRDGRSDPVSSAPVSGRPSGPIRGRCLLVLPGRDPRRHVDVQRLCVGILALLHVLCARTLVAAP